MPKVWFAINQSDTLTGTQPSGRGLASASGKLERQWLRCAGGLDGGGWHRPATCLTLVTLCLPTSRPAAPVSRHTLIWTAAVRNQPPAATDRLQHPGGNCHEVVQMLRSLIMIVEVSLIPCDILTSQKKANRVKPSGNRLDQTHHIRRFLGSFQVGFCCRSKVFVTDLFF